MARPSANRALPGVNLGGWLILEKWMTPTLFDGIDAIDEHELMKQPGALQKLRDHHKNFIREEDFKWMANNGVALVRIPVGYWVFDGDSPYVPCIGRLDWAFTMAEKYGIKVLVSLHGAPGSQNGHDHSGRVGRARWYDSKECRDDTVKVLVKLAQHYKSHPALWGIELLNEPQWRIFQRELKLFYREAFALLTKRLPAHVRIVYSDAFMPRRFAGIIGNGAKHRATLDIHWYHNLFWAYRWVPIKWYYRLVQSHGKLLRRLSKHNGVIVGEWNGIIARERLDRYPTAEHNGIVKEHIARQLNAYQYADAWFYWNYKTEQRGVWHFRSLVEDGAIIVPRNDN